MADGRHLENHHISTKNHPILIKFGTTPAAWNSLSRTVLESPSVTVIKSRLKTHLVDLAHIKQ